MVDYVLRILPGVNAFEMQTIINIYSKNKRESGERYNHVEFLEKLAKKSYMLF
jgi:hypothetical protein